MYTFSQYVNKRFGKRVYKICVDAGFTCPNRDGSKGEGGCSYCNNDAFSGMRRSDLQDNKTLPSIESQIISGKAKLIKRYRAEAFLLYFQPYSNTYAPLDTLKKMYDYVYYDSDIVGISVGTRPDCITTDKVHLLELYTKDKEVWIEYGLESSHDRTLQLINRGHTCQDFLNAIEMTSGHEIKICVHIIFGLPGENHSDMLTTVKRIAALPVHAIKFHPLHIVKGTKLYDQWRMQETNKGHESVAVLKIMELDEYVHLVCDALALLPPSMIIQRLTGEAASDLLIAPEWIRRKNEVINMIHAELKKRNK